MGARCLWCLLNEGGAARAASSPSVERPTSVRMSVRMVTRFVYVLVWRLAGGAKTLCGALFVRACCGGAAEVPRGGVVVHAAAASRVGRLHRLHRESVAAVTLAEALPIQQTPPTTRSSWLASALEHASNEGCKKRQSLRQSSAEQLQTLAAILRIDRARVQQL